MMSDQSTPLFRIVYASRNTIAGNGEAMRAEVERILDASRRNNPSLGITGALMFNRSSFSQVLEGPQAQIEPLIERIQTDHRHADIRLLDLAPVAERAFGQWSMAFAGEVAETHPAFACLATPEVGGVAFDAARAILALLQDVVRPGRWA